MLGNYATPPHPIALILIGRGKYAGEPIATASVYLDLFVDQQAADEVAIKNWSENEGMHEALQAAGIIGPVLRTHCPDPTPRMQVPATIHKLLVT